jgi:membrane protein insertase Oxa1/YidC/SpoIIIJ
MAPFYKKYGNYLIRQYPKAYIKHFILPNLVNFCIPKPEFLGVYNMRSDSVALIAARWFKLESGKTGYRGKTKEITVTKQLPVLFATINLVFLLTFIAISLSIKNAGLAPIFKHIHWVIALLLLANFGFSVLASPIVLRYQVFPMIVAFVFAAIYVEHLISQTSVKSTNHAELDRPRVPAL